MYHQKQIKEVVQAAQKNSTQPKPDIRQVAEQLYDIGVRAATAEGALKTIQDFEHYGIAQGSLEKFGKYAFHQDHQT